MFIDDSCCGLAEIFGSSESLVFRLPFRSDFVCVELLFK